MGAITAYAGLMAKRTGYKALYLSGGGVAANSLGVPDLGISTMEDVLTDARRIVDATQMPLLVDIDTGWGGAFNIGRTIRSFINVGVAAVHMEDQVGQKRCGHRPGKEVVPTNEMVDRVKAAVDARTDSSFVIMARTDAAAVEGIDSAIERACAYVEAGADMIFPEAMNTLDDYRRFKAAVKVPILANLTEFGSTPFFTTDELRVGRRRHRAVLLRRLSRHEQGGAELLRDRAPRRHAEEHSSPRCRPAPSCTTSSATTATKTSSTRCSRANNVEHDGMVGRWSVQDLDDAGVHLSLLHRPVRPP